MYFLLIVALFLIVFYVFTKVMHSLIKGCMTAGIIFVMIVGGYLLFRSVTEPVNLFNMFEIDNLSIRRLE